MPDTVTPSPAYLEPKYGRHSHLDHTVEQACGSAVLRKAFDEDKEVVRIRASREHVKKQISLDKKKIRQAKWVRDTEMAGEIRKLEYQIKLIRARQATITEKSIPRFEERIARNQENLIYFRRQLKARRAQVYQLVRYEALCRAARDMGLPPPKPPVFLRNAEDPLDFQDSEDQD